jgi:hypothetical protein
MGPVRELFASPRDTSELSPPSWLGRGPVRLLLVIESTDSELHCARFGLIGSDSTLLSSHLQDRDAKGFRTRNYLQMYSSLSILMTLA